MSNEQPLELQVEKRTPAKNSSRKLKRLGQVPIVVYGNQTQNLCLSVKDIIAKKYANSQFDNKIFTLQNTDKKINGLKVLKKSVDIHRLTRAPIHMDFLVLNMSQRIKVTVEVLFTGKAIGVKESGGVFQILKRNIEVECLPHEIPNSFDIDISELNLSESYHVSDIQIPSNIKLITPSEEALCSVIESHEEVVATTPTTTEEAADTPSDEKTIEQPKKEESENKE